VSNGTNANITGLPAGLTGVFNVDVFVISGTPTASGTFNYTITITGGCAPATATGSITVNPNAAISLSSATNTGQQSICVNSSIVNITYAATNATSVTVAGLPNGVTGNYSNGIFTIKGLPSATGTFNYTVTATSNCASAVMNGNITVNELPVATITSSLGTTISKGDISVLTATGGSSYLWTGTDIQGSNSNASIEVRPRQTTTYTVKVTNISGCTTEKSITINVNEDLKLIPNNIITPNGDGKNDFWVIKNIDYYPNNKVSVFDRAGRKVYGSSSYKNDWDGTYAGAPLAEAAYFYVIDMGNGYGLIRGTINIIRDKR
ncbi:MAG: gliding motility-associated C-terminal domain-containing protein, partial [Pedobacter sp.]